MEIQMDIKFDDLLKIVKNLPATQLSRLKEEIEKQPEQNDKREAFKTLLLQ